MSKIRDLTGQKFGRIFVIERVKKPSHLKDSHAYYLCKCDCGNVLVINGHNLISKITTSCGCYHKEKVKGNTYGRKECGKSGLNRVIYTYKKGAKRRNISFELTEEQVKTRVKGNCFYCNSEPIQLCKASYRGFTEEGIIHSIFVYNGIDRIDSSIGYTWENTVSCCKHCNTAKMALSAEEFKEHITQIYKHWIQNEKGSNPLKTEEKISKEEPNGGLEVPSYDI